VPGYRSFSWREIPLDVLNAKTGEIFSRANRILTMERLRNQKFPTGFTGQSKRQVIAGFLLPEITFCRVSHNMVFMVDTVLRLLENRG
jgi:hypothetical protein